MGKILLGGRYTAGIFAMKNILYLHWQSELFLFATNAVLDDVDRRFGINISECVKVNLHFGIDFNDILQAHFLAVNILDYRNGAVKLVKLKLIINLHALARRNVVDNNSVFN